MKHYTRSEKIKYYEQRAKDKSLTPQQNAFAVERLSKLRGTHDNSDVRRKILYFQNIKSNRFYPEDERHFAIDMLHELRKERQEINRKNKAKASQQRFSKVDTTKKILYFQNIASNQFYPEDERRYAKDMIRALRKERRELNINAR